MSTIQASAFPKGTFGSWRMERGADSPRRAIHTPWTWWGNKDFLRFPRGVGPGSLVGTPEGNMLSEAQKGNTAAPRTRAQLPSDSYVQPDLGGSSAKTRSLLTVPCPASPPHSVRL